MIQALSAICFAKCICLIKYNHRLGNHIFHTIVLFASFINFNRINSFISCFIWGMQMIQLTGEPGNVATWSLKHILPTHTIFTGRYNLFKMFLMYGLLLMVNQDISWHQCNSKRSASNRCYIALQDQISRVRAAMYHMHGLYAMQWMQLSYATALNSPVPTSENGRLYISSPVPLTHLVYIPWWCKNLARAVHVCRGNGVDAVQNIHFPRIECIKCVFD